MHYGIFAATSKGAELALQVRDVLCADIAAEADVFVKKGKTDAGGVLEYERLSELVKAVFYQYDGLIFIMATGIVVRSIAKLMVSKLQDPAIVVMDENAKHVISLLSGHMGGANALTRKLALALDSDPVITTATDINDQFAPDALAAELGLKVYPKDSIKILNSAMLEGKKIRHYIDKTMPRAELICQRMWDKGVDAKIVNLESIPNDGELKTILSNRIFEPKEGVLYLIPRKLVAGMGCRRGTSIDMLYNALEMACHTIGREITELDMLASINVKSDEKGLLTLAEKLGVEIRFFDQEELLVQIEQHGLSTSNFVEANVGVGNVAEASALCCVENGQILMRKMRYGKATVALIWER